MIETLLPRMDGLVLTAAAVPVEPRAVGAPA
jgi:hypothetical protein